VSDTLPSLGRLFSQLTVNEQIKLVLEVDHEDQSKDRKSAGFKYCLGSIKFARIRAGTGEQAQHPLHHGR
jgi:ABC-type lipopolysaccharide export system ATPase subunit